MSNHKNDKTTAGEAVLIALAVVATVCVVLAAIGIIGMAAWNVGVVGLVAAAGGSVSKIGFWTALFGVFAARILVPGHPVNRKGSKE